MAQLPVKQTSSQWGLSWAIFFGLVLLGFLLYFGLEAIAPPPDAVDTDLVHTLAGMALHTLFS